MWQVCVHVFCLNASSHLCFTFFVTWLQKCFNLKHIKVLEETYLVLEKSWNFVTEVLASVWDSRVVLPCCLYIVCGGFFLGFFCLYWLYMHLDMYLFDFFSTCFCKLVLVNETERSTIPACPSFTHCYCTQGQYHSSIFVRVFVGKKKKVYLYTCTYN